MATISNLPRVTSISGNSLFLVVENGTSKVVTWSFIENNLKGIQGDQGTTGFIGSRGPFGFTGSSSGFTGSRGSLGYSGSFGSYRLLFWYSMGHSCLNSDCNSQYYNKYLILYYWP